MRSRTLDQAPKKRYSLAHMANHKRALGRRSRWGWALSAVLLCSSGVGLVTLMATTSGCAKEPSVSTEPPAADADMKKIIINVFGMT